MTTLEDILSAILTEVNEAQNKSNIHSANICYIYHNDEILKHLSVPNTVVDEFELDLKFAVCDSDRVQASEKLNFKLFTNSINEMAKKISGIVTEYLAQLVDNEHKDTASLNEEILELKENISSDSFNSYLTTNLANELTTKRGLYMSDSGFINEQTANQIIMDLLNQKIFAIEDIRLVLTGDVKVQRDTLLQDLSSKIYVLLEDLKEEILKDRYNPSNVNVDVLITAQELQDIPDSKISSIKFKGKMQKYKWVVDQEIDNINGHTLLQE